MSDLLMKRKAVISDCGAYRYTLSREWGDEKPCVFVMLNPSTADAEVDDPTIRRCIGFARREGCGSLWVVNLFAFRATSPEDMKRARDPVGPENDWTLKRTFETAREHRSPVIAGWGAHGTLNARHLRAHAMAKEADLQLQCFGVTASKQPKHPLYIANAAPLMPWPLQS